MDTKPTWSGGQLTADFPALGLEARPKPPVGQWLRGLEIDLRSLALFRVALGLVLLADLLILIPQIDDFYTDRGVLPREAMLRLLGSRWTISLHLISGEWVVQLALFLVAVLFAIGFTVGYRTRFCAIASWILLASMQARTPPLLHGGDAVLRLLLFWCMFAPLNARYSLDRALNPSTPPLPVRHLSPATLALMFQLCGIYWFAASEKMHPDWLIDRTAVYYALNLDQFVTPLGKVVLDYPGFMSLMTIGTVALELLGPILVLSPFLTAPLRLLMVASFVGFHAGLGLTMRLDLFPWVCAAAWLMFLPATFWEALERRLARRAGAGSVIFFDRDCGFCRKAVLILRELLMLPNTEAREAQSDSEMHALMRARNSWIVRDAEGGLHTGYDGFVALCRRSPIVRWFAGVLAFRPARALGDWAYGWLAGHRIAASRYLGSVTSPPPRELGVAGSLLVLGCLILATLSFVGAQPNRRTFAGRVLSLAMLEQSWRMFAPSPTRYDGWYIIEGVRQDGSRVDLWRGEGEPTDEKPEDVSRYYRNTQWVAYLGAMGVLRNREYRPYFGRYLCRKWNQDRTGAERIVLAHVNLMLEMTPPPGQPTDPPLKELVWQQPCPE